MPTAEENPNQPVIDAQINALTTAGLKDRILLPTHASYASRIDSWWSASSRLKPWCIVQPQSTAEVAKAILALANTAVGDFAVRSGGHSHWSGGSNIQNGVTLDLGHLNSVKYDPGTKVASIGPAGRWSEVYKQLEEQGVMVAGGRDGNVGIGGFVTGAGNSYYTGKYGFGCDSLINAEVVLADGRIVSANANTNPDLWKALKGGSGNLGIVTRFDMATFPSKDIWGGMRASAKTESEGLIKALVNFTDKNHEKPETAFIINFTYMPSMAPDVIVAHVLVDTDGKEEDSIFEEVKKVPELFSDIKKRPMSGIATDYVLPHGLHNVWFTLSFKNDARIVRKAASLNEKYLTTLKTFVSPSDLVTQCLFQPLPTHFSSISTSKGGNILGLDQIPSNALLWLYTVTSKSAEHEPFLHKTAKAFKDELWMYAKSIGVDVDWIYVNYADPSQDALGSYGERNVVFLRETARKFDPEGVLQRRMRSGFKISEVK